MLVGCLANDSIRIYDAISSVEGDALPSRILGGALTLVEDAYVTVVDTRRDVLYVSVIDGILAFDGAATIDGNVAPARHLTGAANGLGIGSPDLRLFLDEANDRLYVTVQQGVLVFDRVSTLTGDVAPSRELEGGSTGFGYLWGIAVDIEHDILYVADEMSNAVHVFDGADSLAGNVAPTRRLAGPAPRLDLPADLFVDAAADTL